MILREYEPTPMPVIEAYADSETFNNSLIKLHSIIKKQMVSVVNNKPVHFNNEVSKLIKYIWNDGYNTGLKHMDQMHGKIDNL